MSMSGALSQCMGVVRYSEGSLNVRYIPQQTKSKLSCD